MPSQLQHQAVCTGIMTLKQVIAPGAARRYAPADGSSTVAYSFVAYALVSVRKFSRNKGLCQSMDPEIAADLRPSADRSAVRTSLVAGGG